FFGQASSATDAITTLVDTAAKSAVDKLANQVETKAIDETVNPASETAASKPVSSEQSKASDISSQNIKETTKPLAKDNPLKDLQALLGETPFLFGSTESFKENV